MKDIVFLAGLPRSGSTLLCNILNQHPEISASSSSPLCHILNEMRKKWSDDSFLLSQIGLDFENVYGKLMNSCRAFMEAWCQSDTQISIDKNRGWIAMTDTLKELYPNFKMIVTLRDLGQIWASIEKQHKKTILLEFADHMEHHFPDGRAEALFNDSGIIGLPLRAMDNWNDTPEIKKHVCFMRFEDLMLNPVKTLNQIVSWLKIPKFKFDLNNIQQTIHEYDGCYNMKYLHQIRNKIDQPKPEDVPYRISNVIKKRFNWFYTAHYDSCPYY